MSLFKKKKEMTPEEQEEVNIKNFLEMVEPGSIKFRDSFVIQDSIYRCIWAIRSYPTTTSEQALLSSLGEKSGVTLHVISKELTGMEEQKLISNASNRARNTRNSATSVQKNIEAQEEFADIDQMIRQLHKNKESLFNTSVFIELAAKELEDFRALQNEVGSELKRLKISYDQLRLRQKDGFLSVMPGGTDHFAGYYSRALPATSVANFHPFLFSGKYCEKGFTLGKDTSGGTVIMDFNERSSTITNPNVLILGMPGMGKSFCAKTIFTNSALQGMSIIIFDPEAEYEELTENLGGTYLDLMSGKYIINVLEPKTFTTADDGESINDDSISTKTYRQKGALTQHISFLRDFFSTYKGLTEKQLDALEIILKELYESKGLNDQTDFRRVPKTAFPILSDLWDFMNKLYENYDGHESEYYYEKSVLRDLRLALQSICVGTQSQYFNGYTNITNAHILTFGMKGILTADASLRGAMLFNCLSYLSDAMLNQRNTLGMIDELYLFLGNGTNGSMTSCEYIRNLSKRCRKFDSALVLATQNVIDLLRSDIAAYTVPLLQNPSHKMIFHLGNIDPDEICKVLQIEQSEYNVISSPKRGLCLFMSGAERYSLQISVPKWKSDLYGTAGGK